MKVQNLHRARQLQEDLQIVNQAIKNATEVTSKFKTDTEGHSSSSEDQLYSFHIAEHRDGSGFKIDCTGLCVGIEIVKFTLQKLQERKQKILDEIETL